MKLFRYFSAAVTTLGLFCGAAAVAQEDSAGAAAQANNPLADITAFNIQNYYVGDLTGFPDASGNQLVLRFAKPISIGESDWLIRASLPFNDLDFGGAAPSISGVGDLDIFAAYQFDTGSPATSFAIGPQVVFPTGKKEVSSEQWQLGLANVYFNASSPKVQYGYLAIYRAGVGDTNGKERVSVGAFQPFLFYQLGDGWYTGTAPIWSYDFKSDNYSVPLGVRLGKVMPRGKTVYNVFVEPQYSVADRGFGVPEWQIFAALNMQFLK